MLLPDASLVPLDHTPPILLINYLHAVWQLVRSPSAWFCATMQSNDWKRVVRATDSNCVNECDKHQRAAAKIMNDLFSVRSPFSGVHVCWNTGSRSGNFIGWRDLRLLGMFVPDQSKRWRRSSSKIEFIISHADWEVSHILLINCVWCLCSCPARVFIYSCGFRDTHCVFVWHTLCPSSRVLSGK